MNRTNNKIFEYPLLFFCVSILLALELYCAQLAYTNYGWLIEVVVFGLISLNIIPLILLLRKHIKSAVFGFLILALLIIPRQLYLSNLRTEIFNESAGIVNYAYTQKLETGSFPKTIQAYEYINPELKSHIEYSILKNNDFQVSYYVGTKTTAHWYRHSVGPNWNFYDD